MLSRFGVPQPVRQYGFGPYRLDLAYPEPKVAIEIDSAQRHSGTASYRRDREKWNLLTRQGWALELIRPAWSRW